MARTSTTDKYQYILSWISEAVDARRTQNALVERTIKAYQNIPLVNKYKRGILSYASTLKDIDVARSKLMMDYALEIPDKGSTVVEEAVESVVSLCMGGVGRFEFGPYDPDLAKDDDIIDLLSSAAKHFYNKNKVDSVVPQYIRNAVLAGEATMVLRQMDSETKIILLGSDQMLTDPKRVRTNQERFIGFTQRESFAAVKNRTKATKSGYVLSSLNEVDVYINNIILEINGSPAIQQQDSFLHERLRADIDTFYSVLWRQYGGSQGWADNNDPNKMYRGDEVEMTYLYDLQNDLYFEVVNRKYITLAKTNPLFRNITGEYYDDDMKKHKVTKKIKLDHPFVQLPFRKTLWDTYPVSPLFRRLDDFDDLCAMESLLFHNTSIAGALTFVGQSSDGAKVARIASIAGEIVDGLPQTFAVLDKKHDDTNLLGLIQRYEQKIKRSVAATDQFAAQGMIGDRATAKEVMAAQGQVSQGLNPFIANVETAMATMGDKAMKLQLIMNKGEYSFVHNGKYAALSPEDIAGDYEVSARLVSSIKIEQEANAQKAVQVIQYVAPLDGIDKKQLLGTLVPIILNTLVNREQAENMIMPAYRIMPVQPGEEQDSETQPITQAELDSMSPEQLDELIKEATRVAADHKGYFDPTLNAQGPDASPEAAMAATQAQQTGVDPAAAAAVAGAQAQAPAPDPTQDPTAGLPADPASQGLPETNPQVIAAGAPQ